MDSVPMLVMMSDVLTRRAHKSRERFSECLLNKYRTVWTACQRKCEMCNKKSTKPALHMSSYGNCREDVSRGRGTKLQPDAKALRKLCTIKLLTQRVDI